MELQEDSVKDRLKSFLAYKRLGQNKFCSIIGRSPGYVNNIRQSIQPNVIVDIKKAFPELNMGWVLTGSGEMLENTNGGEAIEKVVSDDIIMVPVLNLDARGGLLPNANCDVSEYTTSLMPFSSSVAKKGDVVVPVYGDSMIPKYAPGTLILIRNIELWSDYLELGSTYVLELIDDRRTIKNIMKGDNNEYFRLESINPKYEPTEIPKKIIRHVFSVLMAVRKETM